MLGDEVAVGVQGRRPVQAGAGDPVQGRRRGVDQLAVRRRLAHNGQDSGRDGLADQHRLVARCVDDHRDGALVQLADVVHGRGAVRQPQIENCQVRHRQTLRGAQLRHRQTLRGVQARDPLRRPRQARLRELVLAALGNNTVVVDYQNVSLLAYHCLLRPPSRVPRQRETGLWTLSGHVDGHDRRPALALPWSDRNRVLRSKKVVMDAAERWAPAPGGSAGRALGRRATSYWAGRPATPPPPSPRSVEFRTEIGRRGGKGCERARHPGLRVEHAGT